MLYIELSLLINTEMRQLQILLFFGSRVVSLLDSHAVRPVFKSQPPRCRVTVLGKLFTPTVPLFTKQRY